MPSLGDTYDGTTRGWPAPRLYLGATLLFVGAAVAAPGLARVMAGVLADAGVADATALSVAIAVAALAVPVVGAGLLWHVPATFPARVAGATGVLLSTLAVAGFLLAVPPAAVPRPASVPAFVVLGYAAGAMLALWSPIVAAGLAASDARKRPTTTTAFVRDTGSGRPGGRVPADGGEDEEQLAFLLDRDRNRNRDRNRQ